MAYALLQNRNLGFWSEVKMVHKNANIVNSQVDERCGAENVSDLFASKDKKVYNSVSCTHKDKSGLQQKCGNEIDEECKS